MISDVSWWFSIFLFASQALHVQNELSLSRNRPGDASNFLL